MENAKLVVKTDQQVSSPREMIQMAISSGADLEKLEKLLTLQERWEANEARKVYARAFAVAQANILPVIKSKYNQQTKSKYSDLSDVIETTQPIYTKEGFSVTFDEADSPIPENIRIIAEVLHSSGHKELYHYDVPLDGKGIQGNANMTKIHGKASSTSYGRRYLMCMIWNIPTQDDDGIAAGIKEFIDDKQLGVIRDLIADAEIKEEKLCGFLKVDGLDKLPKSEYQKAIVAISSRKQAKEQKAQK